jgi:hypothetical protein
MDLGKIVRIYGGINRGPETDNRWKDRQQHKQKDRGKDV